MLGVWATSRRFVVCPCRPNHANGLCSICSAATHLTFKKYYPKCRCIVCIKITYNKILNPSTYQNFRIGCHKCYSKCSKQAAMCIVSMRTCHKSNASGLMIISFVVCTHTNQCGLTICLVIVWATLGNMKKGRVDSALNTAPVVTCMKTLMMVFNFIFWVRILFSVFSIIFADARLKIWNLVSL